MVDTIKIRRPKFSRRMEARADGWNMIHSGMLSGTDSSQRFNGTAGHLSAVDH